MMPKQWKMRAVDQETVRTLAQTLSLSPITAAVLVGRGIGLDQASDWLSVSHAAEHDPFLLPDMEKAIDRLHRAIGQGERMCFYGDYDVDGISATSLHLTFFSKRGAKAEVYIPHRQDEGYGLNTDAIRKLAARGISVLLTADCGTTSHREIDLARHLGIDVIVTDHHQIPAQFPSAFAFLNPYRQDSRYPFQGLCSGGLAYKVAQAYALKYDEQSHAVEDYRDLAALATIADVVPLHDENRSLVRDGLAQITQGTRCGIRALKQVLGIREACSANTVGFRLAPVINAAGRLAHAEMGVRLLTSESEDQAVQLAHKLEQLNRQRRHIEQEMFEQAIAMIGRDHESAAIVVGAKAWHVGVIGIVASRLVERFHRPAVVVAFDQSGMGKGSVRSVPGYNVYQALEQCQEHLEGFGGHPAAAGLTVRADEFAAFQQKLTQVVATGIESASKIPILDIDANVHLSEIQPWLLRELDHLHPFGMGNPEPTFAAHGLKVLEKTVVGDNHLKIVVRQHGSVPLEGIGFRMGGLAEIIDSTSKPLDVAFMPEINRWKGYDRVQLRLRDVRMSQALR